MLAEFEEEAYVKHLSSYKYFSKLIHVKRLIKYGIKLTAE